MGLRGGRIRPADEEASKLSGFNPVVAVAVLDHVRILCRVDPGVGEAFRLVGCPQVLDQVVDVAVQHRRDVAQVALDPVIGDPVLREVVGANLLAAFAGADLRPAGVAPFLGETAPARCRRAGSEAPSSPSACS